MHKTLTTSLRYSYCCVVQPVLSVLTLLNADAAMLGTVLLFPSRGYSTIINIGRPLKPEVGVKEVQFLFE